MSTATVPDLRDNTLTQEFERIFREQGRFIYRTAYGVTGSTEDAQDILQTIFLRLWRRELPPSFWKNPKPYLYRAAVNLALDIVRARKRRVFVRESECLEIPASAEKSIDGQIHERLYEAIAKLNPEAAEIVILRYLHNFSDAQIAKMLGTSRTTIAVRLFRVRARLKKLIRASLGGEP